MARDQSIEEILDFWFGDPPEGDERPRGKELWFVKSAAVDRQISKKFGRLVDKAVAGELDDWASTPKGRLAVIILLDQFNRNIHRERPEAYRGDEAALQLCYDGLDDAMDKALTTEQRCFFYMPMMHAEDTDAQLACVDTFQELVDEVSGEAKELCESFLKHAREHRDVVERFERFPHRNPILGRTSTPDESAFLQQSGSL